MARRKWTAETIAQSIVDLAGERLRSDSERPATGDFARLEALQQLDSIALQSLGVRLGRYVWECLPSPESLEDLAVIVVRAEASDESLTVMQRAFLRVAGALREAAARGEMPVAAPSEAGRITRLADNVVRGRGDGQSIVTGGLVRSLIEWLLGEDRSAFRSRLGEIGGALVKLDSAGLDGRIEDLAAMPLYWELKSLQWVLNGVLQASRPHRAYAGARGAVTSAEAEISSESLRETGIEKVVEQALPGTDHVPAHSSTFVETIHDGVDSSRQQAQSGLERLSRE